MAPMSTQSTKCPQRVLIPHYYALQNLMIVVESLLTTIHLHQIVPISASKQLQERD